jgi:hypothetical protein
MTNNITSADLNQYPVLIDYLKKLYEDIISGKASVDSGVNDFEVYHNLLFPVITNSGSRNIITYTDKLTTTSVSGASKGLTTLDGKTISLKHLLTNTLDPTFNQTICSTATPSTYSNASLDTAGTKDHLCFITLNSAKTDIEPDTHPITNILYSKYAIEIFIKIIEALHDCYISNENEISSLFTTTTNIYIVCNKLKEEHTVGVPRGIYIKNNGTLDNDTPLEGIYLYIGDLENMFHINDIKIVDNDSVAISNKATYLTANTAIFTANNKLKYTATGSGKYYFGYLEYSTTDDTTKYTLQSGTSTNPDVESTGTMTRVNLNAATISSATIKSGSTITGLKILNGAIITSVPAVNGVAANTYNITEGKISGTITVNNTSKIAADAVIENSDANNPKIVFGASGASVFTKTGSNRDASVKSGSSPTIKVGTPLTTADDIPIPADIQLPVTGIRVSNFTFTTATAAAIGSDITSTTTALTTADIAGVLITSFTKTDIRITGTFQNLEGVAYVPKSYYEQNIYYIFNFIKMIKNIKKDSFSTTIKYLRVYILCYKSLLLASIRAANIFYNNRYKLSAVAISYEKNFLNNSSQDSGGLNCGIISLNDFVKYDRKATFSLVDTCTPNSNVLPSDTNVKGYEYILYKKSSGNQHNNESYFRKYDVLIQEELDNIKNNNIKSSTSSLGITNFKFFSSYMIKDVFKITCNDANTNDKYVGGTFQFSTPSDEYDKIKKFIDDDNTYAFNNGYRIYFEQTSFKVQKFSHHNDTASPTPNKRIDIELVQDKTISPTLYTKLNVPSPTTNQPHPVYIYKITSKDIDKDYNAIVKNTNTVEENISMYKTKIKNNTTLYELHKSRNNLLYNQVLSYLIIVAVIISILVIINVANVEKPLIKSITLACLAVIIILFMSYYIMNTLYIEEGFSQGSASSSYSGYELCNSKQCKITDGTTGGGDIKQEGHIALQKIKKDNVKIFLEENAKNLTLMIILEGPKITNDSLKGNNEKLVAISKNIYNDKLYLKDVLYSKKSDSEMNVDVLKYENKNYDIYIVCVLFLALIMVGSYTINIYTDNKYLDLLILIMVILFVCLFTYFVLYTNRVVRTVSTNYYWGNEYENQYI